jgi:hypothetical protein
MGRPDGLEGTHHRRTWPFLATPLAIYLTVMVPVCGLELFLIVARAPAWMRWSAGAVVFFTIVGLIRGYVRRLVLSPRGASLRGLVQSIEIDWTRVRRVGTYTPGGGLGGAKYAYITTRDTEPLGKWDIDRETIQVQDRPGLMEAIAHHFDPGRGGDRVQPESKSGQA